MLSCAIPAHRGVSEHIDLGNQGDTQVVCNGLDPGNFLLGHRAVRPAVPGSDVAPERSPGLDDGIIHLVIRRHPDETFHFPGFGLVEPADMYTPECQCGTVLDYALRNYPALYLHGPSFRDRYLPKGIKGISDPLESSGIDFDAFFTNRQFIILRSETGLFQGRNLHCRSIRPIPFLKMACRPLPCRSVRTSYPDGFKGTVLGR